MGTAASALARVDARFVTLTIDHGVFSMVRNGFVDDPAKLNHLLATAASIAESQAAAILGLTPVDPGAFHRTHRRLPFPGRALAIVAGTVPGTEVDGHVAFTAQGGRTSGSYRTAVLLPASPGATTPVGGVVHEPTAQYVEGVDGLAVSWPRTRGIGRLDAVERTRDGVTALRALGVIAA